MVVADLVQIFFGYGLCDVNSPIRLMRVNAFKEELKMFPDKAVAPNVIVTELPAEKDGDN